MSFSIWGISYVCAQTSRGLPRISPSVYQIPDILEVELPLVQNRSRSKIGAEDVLELLQVGMVIINLSFPTVLSFSLFRSEILSEVTLPESGIADIEYPHMFPSPPELSSDSGSSVLSPAAITPSPGFESPSLNIHSNSMTIQQEQEKSWFYYLSEIALRRIGNRILNAFYREETPQWVNMNAQETTKIAEEFIRQLEQWYDGLPPSLSYSQDLSDMPTEELSYMIRARMLELRSWIYRPFLYYIIHSKTEQSQGSIAKPFADQALLYSVRLIECNSIRHRHHGVWYTCRASASAALCILSAVRSDRIEIPMGWEDTVQLAIETLLLWEVDAPGDLRKARIILTELYCQTIGERDARRSPSNIERQHSISGDVHPERRVIEHSTRLER